MTMKKSLGGIALESGGKKLSRSERNELKRQALRRYEKHRRQNILARPGAHDMILVLDRLKSGFNVAKIFRTAEVMGVCEVHLIGIGPFDPAPAKGGFKKVPARFFDEFDQCYADLQSRDFTMFALDPSASCTNQLSVTHLPRQSAFIFGHEEFGHSFDRTQFPDIGCLTIPSFGTTESLNVSIAASIVSYEYIRQHADRNKAATET